MFSRIGQTKLLLRKKIKAVLSQLNVEYNCFECVLKSLTFNDERIGNGVSLKVEAIVLSSIGILFGWILMMTC